jgi:hypothetical protein
MRNTNEQIQKWVACRPITMEYIEPYFRLRMQSSGMWRRVDLVGTDVPEERNAVASHCYRSCIPR